MKRDTYPKDDYEILARHIDQMNSKDAGRVLSDYRVLVSEKIAECTGKSRNNTPDFRILDIAEQFVKRQDKETAKQNLKKFVEQVTAFINDSTKTFIDIK